MGPVGIVLRKEDLPYLLLPLTCALSYGAPGVEFTGLHRDTATVTQMHFLPGQVSLHPHWLPWPPCPPHPRPAQSWSLLIHQGRLLTLLDDSSLHLWEIVHHNGCAHLEEALSFQPPSRPGFDCARYRRTWLGTSCWAQGVGGGARGRLWKPALQRCCGGRKPPSS